MLLWKLESAAAGGEGKLWYHSAEWELNAWVKSTKENWNEISLPQSNSGFMKRTTAESCRLLVVTGNTVPGGLYLCRRGSTVLEFENA